MNNTLNINELERRARAVKFYFDTTVSYKLGIKVEIDDTTARVLVLNMMTRGRGYRAWARGKVINVAEERLVIQAISPNEHITISSEKQETYEPGSGNTRRKPVIFPAKQTNTD